MMTYKFPFQAQIDSLFPCEAGEGQEGGVKIREATKFQNPVAARHAYTPTPTLPRCVGEGQEGGVKIREATKFQNLVAARHAYTPTLPRCAGEGVKAGY